MPTSRAPTVRQRRLGAALYRLRKENELSADDVAWRLGWSASKVSRIETARIGLRQDDLVRLLKLYRPTEHMQKELLALSLEAGKKGWWAEYPELRADQAAYIALEDEADTVRAFESQTMNGLLQTEDYARRLIHGWGEVMPRPDGVIERELQVRMRRQQLIWPPRSLRLEVVLDESVLLRRVGGPEIMRRQLERLLELAELPNITLRVLPLDGDHGAALSSFILLEYASKYEVTFPSVVHTESRTADHIQDEVVTHEYRRQFEWLTGPGRSLDPRRSAELVREINVRRWGAR